MKKSSDYINQAVNKVNKNYSRLQNKTEELFFECLIEGRSVEYFIKKLDDIWGKIDHSYLNEQIDEYINIIHENNLEQLNIQDNDKSGKNGLKIGSNVLLLIGLGYILSNEKKFTDIIKKKYEMYYNSPEYKKNKEEYLKRKVKTYDNQVIPYFNKDGEIVRYVQLSTYLAMKYNTALTRAGWQRTIQDGEDLGYEKFWIPPHLFSCDHCAEYQGRLLTVDEVNDFLDQADKVEGDILHPNCKCSLLIYVPGTKLIKQRYSNYEIDEYYNIRQKVNGLTLKKERTITEMKIYKMLGYQDEVDKLNNQRKVINSQIRDLIDELPTEEMKKKVVAINR
jgi:hypothetical protein